MKKIWSLRKAPDLLRAPTLLLLLSPDAHPSRSASPDLLDEARTADAPGMTPVSHNLGSSASVQNIAGVDGSSSPASAMNAKSFSVALADPSYDDTLLSAGWLNIVFKPSSASDSDSNLRLCFAELRGSRLVIYKAPPHMNIKNFHLESSSSTSKSPQKRALVAQSSITRSSLLASTAIMSFSPSGASDSTIPCSLPTGTNGKVASVPLKSVPEKPLSYMSAAVPHPGLSYDVRSHRFLSLVARIDESAATATDANFPPLSLEALVHFYLFATDPLDESVTDILMHVLPLFPSFLDVITYINKMVAATITGQIQGPCDTDVLALRVGTLLLHVEANFCSYLFHTDISRLVNQTIDLLAARIHGLPRNSALKAQLLIDTCKSRIHSRHESFSTLMSTFSSGPRLPDDRSAIFANPSFMQSADLYALATAICDIDLAFAQSWNSNIDKSLLLASTLSLTLPAERGSMVHRNPLVFKNDVRVHYLARLLVQHLFSGMADDLCLDSTRSLALAAKARVLERWIDLGCLLDKMGNMSSWLGIATVLLSQPILRLAGVWSCVSSRYIALLRNDWLPVLYELDRRYLSNGPIKAKMPAPSSSSSSPSPSLPSLPNPSRIGPNGDISFDANDSYHIMAPRGIGRIYSKDRVVPYFGDMLVENSRDGSSLLAALDKTWKKINYSFARWGKYLDTLADCPRAISYNDSVLRHFAHHRTILANENSARFFCLSTEVNENDLETLTPASAPVTVESPPGGFIEPLLALIATDADSLTLEKIMLLSVAMEPVTPQAYSKALSPDHVQVPKSLESSAPCTASASRPPFISRYMLQHLFSKVDYERVLTHPNAMTPIDEFVGCATSGITFSPNPFANDTHTTRNDAETEAEMASPALLMVSDAFGMWPPAENGAPSAGPEHGRTKVQDQRSGLAVLPQFASVDRLIDLLLIDATHIADNVYLDINDYRDIFVMTYPSFITTHDLLKQLMHRFICSGNAVISIMKRAYLKANNPQYALLSRDCPNWEVDPSADMAALGAVDYSLLLLIQTNLLKVLIALLNNSYPLFASDLANSQIMISFMKLFSNEIVQWYNSQKIEPALLYLFERLVDHYRTLKKTFIKKSYRPMELNRRDSFIQSAFRFTNTVAEVPYNRNLPGHKNIAKIEKFLHKFDKMAHELFASTKAQDWSEAFMLLESVDETNGYVAINSSHNSRLQTRMQVWTFAEFLQEFKCQDNGTNVWERLPAVLRKALKLHRKLRVYMQLQLTDTRIGEEERLDRMKTVLLMAKICQLKMEDYSLGPFNTSGIVPSFFETALTSAVYSPESRVYSAEWQKAASLLNPEGLPANLDDLSSLLPQSICMQDLTVDGGLTPCFSWILENICQLAKYPSFNGEAINFTKLLWRYKFISQLTANHATSKLHASDIKDFEFLFALNDRLCPTLMQLLDDAPVTSTPARLFGSVLDEQQKVSAENAAAIPAYSAGSSADSPTPQDQIPDKTPEMAQVTMIQKKQSLSSLRRQLLAYRVTPSSRFKISGIFSKTRPSNGFAAAGPQDKAVPAQDLPPHEEAAITAASKPHMVIPLRSKKAFPVYTVPLGFRIESDSSEDSFFFQAPSEQELAQWLMRLDYALRHWFRSSVLNKKYISSHTTFGMPLEYVCSRDRTMVPCMLTDIFREIEQYCIDDIGIYRISTSVSEVANAKQTIDKLGTLNFEERGYDTHVLASMVKLFFRELPSALMPDETIDMILKIRQQFNGNQDERAMIEQTRGALRTLQPVRYHTLCALIEHLHKVSLRSSHNKMTPSNLATVVGPALTEALSMDALVMNFGSMNTIVESLITNYEEMLGGWQLG